MLNPVLWMGDFLSRRKTPFTFLCEVDELSPEERDTWIELIALGAWNARRVPMANAQDPLCSSSSEKEHAPNLCHYPVRIEKEGETIRVHLESAPQAGAPADDPLAVVERLEDRPWIFYLLEPLPGEEPDAGPEAIAPTELAPEEIKRRLEAGYARILHRDAAVVSEGEHYLLVYNGIHDHSRSGADRDKEAPKEGRAQKRGFTCVRWIETQDRS